VSEAEVPHAFAIEQAPLIGRALEVAFLTERLERAECGNGGIVLIGGEPGIGKSRLVTEIANEARARQWLVLRGHAYEPDGMPPYLPFVEAIRDCLRWYPESTLDNLAELVPLIPSVITTSAVGAANSASNEVERYRLFEAVAEFLLGAADRQGQRGLLLCLEDLHWADRASLQLLQHLTRKLGDSRLLLIGTFRPVHGSPRHPLHGVLAELTRQRLDYRVLLAPLSENDSDALVMALAGGSVAGPVLRAIYRQTEGNPFFIEEVVRQLSVERQNLLDPRLAEAGWGISEGVREVIGSRLVGLAPRTLGLPTSRVGCRRRLRARDRCHHLRVGRRASRPRN
jgi:predicted ATPase